ncbi:MAG: hypothetical protein Q4F57_06935 [Weeksellaceae bacterium]|nr:hypothetical protein [Weeksellaceae bacterium]
MKTKFHIVFFCLLGVLSLAQPIGTQTGADRLHELNRLNDTIRNVRDTLDSPPDSLQIFQTTISDYQYWKLNQPKQNLDTTLTIDHYYRHNVYQKDLFGYQIFPNHNQALNPLKPQLRQHAFSILPVGKSFQYVGVEDVRYFDVKTPTTEFFYESGVKEGQNLITTFTHNPNSQINYAITYQGLRSQGSYLRQLAARNNLIASANYHTRNYRYNAKMHIASHRLDNEENAGLNPESLQGFLQADPRFFNRVRLTPNLQSAQSTFGEKRGYFEHSFGVIPSTDTANHTTYPLRIRHRFTYTSQHFEYLENQPETYYPFVVLPEVERRNNKIFNKLENVGTLEYNWRENLWLEAGILHQSSQLKFDPSLALSEEEFSVSPSLSEQRLGALAQLKFLWRERVNLHSQAEITHGNIWGSRFLLHNSLYFEPIEGYPVQADFNVGSHYPALNYFNNQSFYQPLNFQNSQFSNTAYQNINLSTQISRYRLSVIAQAYNYSNYVYLNSEMLPTQLSSDLRYATVGARFQPTWRKFNFDLQALYQQSLQNGQHMPLPSVVARATAYYSTAAFQNNAHINTGASIYWYSAFESPEFSPILNEFYLPGHGGKIGNYPQLDGFFNLRVQRMRIYLRGENINSFFMRGNYLSTPQNPARDFRLQIGIHWFLFT